MPQIPIQHTQIQPSSVSVPRVPMDIKGPSLVAKVGSALVDFGQKMDKARESSQLAQAQTEWKEGILEFKNSLDNDTDYATYEERFDDYSAALHKQASDKINHKGAKKTFDFIANDSSVVEKAKIKHQANQVEIRFMEADYFKQLNSAVKREDRDFIISATSSAIEGGYVDPIVGEKAREAALHKVEYATVWNDIIDIRDRDEALATIKDTEGLSPGEKNALMGAWKGEDAARQAKAMEEQQTKEEEARAAILPQLRDGTITTAEIGASALSTEEKYKWQERLLKRNKKVAGGEDNPFNIIDSALDAQIMKTVYSDNPPTKEGIQAWVGDGLTVARAEHWIAKLEKPDKGYKRALEYLQSQIMPRQALTVGESSPNAASYWQSVMALDDFMETEQGRDLSGNEILKKAVELAPDYVLSLEDQIEAAKKKWAIEEPGPKKGWWESTKEWFTGDEEKEPPEPIMESISLEMSDEEIGNFLTDNGYISNPETIATYRKNNGL